jgi:hypothetical protein
MLPVVVMPDVEAWATGYLRDALAARTEPYASGVTVSTTVPNPRPARFVTVRRDGGGRVDLMHEAPRLGVNVWAATEADATDLASLVEGLLLAVRAVDGIAAVSSLSGPSPVADEQPRRYLTFEITMRGVVA